MIPVSASARLRSLLTGAADGPLPLVHTGPDAVYVDLAGHCLGVLSSRATLVPNGLRSQVASLSARSASVRDGVLHLDGEAVVIGRLVEVSVPRLALAAKGPAVYPARVADVVGRGDGLTPYEDDVLCGWIALHRAAGLATPDLDADVRASRHRTTALSAELLDCAMRGEVLPAFAAYVRSIGTAAEAARAADLAAVGHSSGRGLLSGAGLALAALSTPQQGAA